MPADYFATLEEVAAALGVSRARAYQIECAALRNFLKRLLIRLHQEGIEFEDLFASFEPGPKNNNGTIDRLFE